MRGFALVRWFWEERGVKFTGDGKLDPQIRVSDRSVVQEWPPNLTSELSGRVKRPPQFDARGAGLLHFVRNDGEWGLDCFTSLAMTGSRVLDCFTSFAMTGGGGLDCFISLAMTGSGGLDCFTSLAMTGSGVAGLLRFARNDGCEVGGLPRFARNDGSREWLDCFTSLAMTGSRVLDCFTSFAMTGSGVLDCRALFAMTGGERLDCFTLFAMTGEEGAGLPCFARNDGERGLDCHASLAMTGVRSVDCHASLAMTGREWLEKVKHWKSLKKIALSLFMNILSWVFSWVMNLKMKKSKWLPAGFWDDFDKTFSRLFTGANLVALGFSGLYYAIYWILERIYSSLFGGLLGVYSIIGNGSLKGELLQRWLPAGDAFFPNMWYLSVIGLAVVSLSFVIAQLVNKRKGNLTRFSFWLMLFFFVLLALPYVTMFCNGISYFLQQ